MEFDVKEKVKKHYRAIAQNVKEGNKSSCGCGASCCGDVSNSFLTYDREKLKNLPKEAVNASLGCADPILFADLKEGETVLDLGSGGGIDVLTASQYVGNSGKVYGLDMTDEMLELADKNRIKMGVKNVEFIKGYIEEIPLQDETVDVIISNCVINLSENKEKALAEAYRVLKKGGRIAIADIVALKDVSHSIRQNAEMWVSCIAGALKVEEYKRILEKVGFENIEIQPAHIYTKSVIKSIVEQKGKNLEDLYPPQEIEILDGAFAGASIKALK